MTEDVLPPPGKFSAGVAMPTLTIGRFRARKMPIETIPLVIAN